MNTLLTNKRGAVLRKRLSELISLSGELKVLVGFFYFSGIKALYEALVANPKIRLRILVGMETERVMGRLVECSLEETDDFGGRVPVSDFELAERYLASLRRAVNAPEFDKQSFHERFIFFLTLLREGRLLIRKTREPNHAKLYIFDLAGEAALLAQSAWITGSSNLTLPGLTAQHELNVEIRDFGTEEVNALFEELWIDAVLLTENEAVLKSMLALLGEESIVAPVTPYEAYAMVLKAYLDQQAQVNATERLEKMLEANGFRKYQYQLDAVNQALTILKEYGGVIIADVVGLGKSVIASMIARGTFKRGIVIAPPGLLGDEKKRTSGWQDYRNAFKLHGWELFSGGLLENALNYVQNEDDVEVVIIDEAHRFKNQDTQDYEQLCNICRGRQVILLTATPFNNSPADIFALLKLFIVPNKSKITLDNQLAARFATYDLLFRRLSEVQKLFRSADAEKRKRAQKAYAKLHRHFLGKDCGEALIDGVLVKTWARRLAHEMRQLLEPVIIRRNRLDLRSDPDYSQEVKELSTMRPPVEQFFELTPDQSAFYELIINHYFGEDGVFKGAIYQPFAYSQEVSGELDEQANREKNQQSNLYDFMRRLLVKRFESSFGSFEKSIENFERIHMKVRQFIEKTGKYILDRKLVENYVDKEPEVIEQAMNDFIASLDESTLPKNARIYVIDEFTDADRFRKDLSTDIAMFREIRRRMRELGLCAHDPKADKLEASLAEVLDGRHPDIPLREGEPDRKVIVFSEYTDTIKHLAEVLGRRFHGKIITVAGALSTTHAETIKLNFDAGVKASEQQNEYSILLATDKMSEGYNLNRAGVVINYDIPWNPTRVIQRVGRINRIGNKVFEELYIFNFFPTEVGAPIAKSREIATQKMFMIHNTIGEDAQIFDIDETPTASSLYHKIQQSPEETEQESFLTKVKKIYLQIKSEHPEVIEKIKRLPFRVKTARKADDPALVVFKKKGLGLFAVKVSEGAADASKAEALTMEEAIGAIQCGYDELRLELGPTFWPRYEVAGAFHECFPGGGSSTISLEFKARNNLASGMDLCRKNGYTALIPFLRTLLEDIQHYGSLPDYTLRRIVRHYALEAKPNSFLKFVAELELLKREIGEHYLDAVKRRLNYSVSETIIAVENQ